MVFLLLSMGNAESHLQLEGHTEQTAERFNASELKVIKETFKDLSYLSGNEKYIDKATFLQYFHLPGLIGERLFAAFDKKNEGFIRYVDFFSSLAVLCRGTWEEKVEFIFKLYDLTGSNTIAKKELLALINHVPKNVIELYWDQRTVEPRYQDSNVNVSTKGVSEYCVLSNEISHTRTKSWYGAEVLHGKGKNIPCIVEMGPEGSLEDHSSANCTASFIPNTRNHIDETSFSSDFSPDVCGVKVVKCAEGVVQSFSNEKIVAHAFKECNLSGSGSLSITEFKLWMERNPIMITYLQSVFPYDAHRDENKGSKHLPFCHNRRLSIENSPLAEQPMYDGTTSSSALVHTNLPLLMGEGEDYNHEETRRLLLLIARITSNVEIREEVPRLLAKLNDDHSSPPNVFLESLPPSHSVIVRHAQSSLSPSSTDSTSVRSCSRKYNGTASKLWRKRREPGLSTSRPGQEHKLIRQNPNVQRLDAVRRGLSITMSRDTMNHLDGEPMPDNFVVTKEGWLIKKGNRLRVLTHRWFVLLGNCIYYYARKNGTHPKGVMFLLGSFVEPTSLYGDRPGYWGFEISRVRNGQESVKLLYTNSQVERDSWVFHLRKACKAVPIEEDYHIGQVLGKGRFSRVCACVNKRTLERKAVKIINKALMDDEEKELVRSEIAIMKLIDHPNIVHLEDIYEGKHQIYIVIELYSGGELFDRIVGHSCFTEDEAYPIIHPLVKAVAYLHSMGIIHRDLKPENILCGHDVMDIKIADFGLSKLIYPDEVMKLPCGTLSYVAPEVLTLSGYGKEADIWSIGIIFYLLICGTLPFDGDTRKEIIAKTIAAEFDRDNPGWEDLSADVQSIICGMLNKDVNSRLTAVEVLSHHWMTSHAD